MGWYRHQARDYGYDNVPLCLVRFGARFDGFSVRFDSGVYFRNERLEVLVRAVERRRTASKSGFMNCEAKAVDDGHAPRNS
jgi:hypothetical protein